MQTASGTEVPLSTLVNVTTATDPNALTQYNQLNSATFQAVPWPGVTIGQAVGFLEQQAAELFPENFTHAYLGDSRQYVEEGNKLLYTLLFAAIIIYLVLAAQFESLLDPLAIMVSVPMAMCGALLPLFIGITTVNIYSQVGLVTLIGLISKHGILMVEFAKELQRHEKLDRRHAIVRAAAVRFRPFHDDRRHGRGAHSHGARHGSRCRKPVQHRPRYRLRADGRDDLHAVRAADGLHLHRCRSPARDDSRAGGGVSPQ